MLSAAVTNAESTPQGDTTIPFVPDPNIADDHLMRELKREEDAVTSTLERFNRNYSRMIESNHGAETLPAFVFIRRVIDQYARALQEFLVPDTKGNHGWNSGRQKHIRALMLELKLEAGDYAFITLRSLLNAWMSNNDETLQSLAALVAKACLQEHEYRKMRTEDEPLTGRIARYAQRTSESKAYVWKALHEAKVTLLETPDTMVPDMERIILGTKLLEILIESTGAFYLDKLAVAAHDTPIVLRAVEETDRILRDSSEWFAFFQPYYPIMLVPPAPWTSLWDGGYYLPTKQLQPTLIKLPRKLLTEHVEGQADLNVTLEAVNNIQSVAWQINKPVLDVMDALWETTGGGVAGLPPRDAMPMPPKPWGSITDDAEWKAYKETHPDEVKSWCKAAEAVYTEERTMFSHRLRLTQYILPVAKELAVEEKLYFPWTLDFRGRLYPLPAYVNPQADDLGKSILQFAEGTPLGDSGAYWLAVHGANVAGYDKISNDDRVRWVFDNQSMILACANNPLDCREWTDMDSPFQFLAFCFEWKRYQEEGATMISHLPIAMDGTCNGLQHLSAMLQDERGGTAVNLVPSVTPKDVYMEVKNETEQYVKDDLNNPPDETSHAYAAIWQDKISRKLVKRPTMTTPYGVTYLGMRDQIRETIRKEHVLKGVTIPNAPLSEYITRHINKAIGNVVQSARQAMSWLQGVAREAAEQSQGMLWRVPGTGFIVVQKYRAIKGKRIECYIGKTRIQLTVPKNHDDNEQLTLDNRRQVQGIAPNFVHSMDAAMLMLTVNQLQKLGIRSYAFIHDSYGVPAAHVQVLHQVLREKFIQLYYGTDVLGMFKAEQEARLGVKLAEVPSKGTLDISQVRHSQYFFA